MKISDNNKWTHNYSLMWHGAYMGISLLLIFLLPFPYDFISVLGLLVLVNYIRYRSIMKRYKGPSGVKNMFDSISSGMDSSTEMSLRYFCMSCGKEHKEISCPNCGSKMKKIGGEVFAQIYYKKVTSPPCFIHETDRETLRNPCINLPVTIVTSIDKR